MRKLYPADLATEPAQRIHSALKGLSRFGFHSLLDQREGNSDAMTSKRRVQRPLIIVRRGGV